MEKSQAKRKIRKFEFTRQFLNIFFVSRFYFCTVEKIFAKQGKRKCIFTCKDTLFGFDYLIFVAYVYAQFYHQEHCQIHQYTLYKERYFVEFSEPVTMRMKSINREKKSWH